MATDTTAPNPLGSLGTLLGSRQMLLLFGLSVSIAIGVTAAFWLREPSYELLYSNLSDRDVGEVMDSLRSENTPYRLDNGSLMVPSEDVYAARLRLSSQGLPRGAGFGLEIIEGESSFSTSQFMENARYHHALETELGRTISNLQPVQGARVHLALPKPTVFLRKSNKPSASVFLDLFPGRVLEEPQVKSIVHLVASSIPELESSHVTVVDQRGTLLNSPDSSDTAALSGREFAYVERVQNAYVDRIVNLLTPMIGPGRVRATVNADIDFTVREETREVYDPAATVVRSEQVSEDTQRGGVTAGQGIPGALSNQPPVGAAADATEGAATAAASADTAAPPTRVSVQSTRNFEVDRQLSHTKDPANSIQRLSVAVLVDNISDVDEKNKPITRPLNEDELAEIERMVQGAVGFSEARGDTISVSNVAFYEGPKIDAPEGPGFFSQPLVKDILRQLPAIALLLVVALGVIRPIVLALSKAGTGVASGGQSLPSGVGGAPAADMVEQPAAPLTFDDKVNVAKQLASNDPERVAQVVRAWVQDS